MHETQKYILWSFPLSGTISSSLIFKALFSPCSLNPQTENKSLCFQHIFDVPLRPTNAEELNLKVIIFTSFFKHMKKRPYSPA